MWARYETGSIHLCDSCSDGTNRWAEIRDASSSGAIRGARQILDKLAATGGAYLDDYCGEAPGANSATCLPRLTPGTPCIVEASTIDPCQMDARCAPDAAGDNVCIPLAGLGKACDATTTPCVRSLICTNGACMPSLGPGPDCGG